MWLLSTACFSVSHRALNVSTYNDRLAELELDDPARTRAVRARIEKAVAHDRAFPLGKGYYGPGHQAQIRDFVRAVRTRTAPFVSFADAAETDRFVFEAYRSAGRAR